MSVVNPLSGKLPSTLKEVNVVKSKFENKEDRLALVFEVTLPKSQSASIFGGLDLDLGPTTCLRRLWANIPNDPNRMPKVGTPCVLDFDLLEEQEEWFDLDPDNNGVPQGVGHVVMIFVKGTTNPVREHKRTKEAFLASKVAPVEAEVNIPLPLELGATLPVQ